MHNQNTGTKWTQFSDDIFPNPTGANVSHTGEIKIQNQTKGTGNELRIL